RQFVRARIGKFNGVCEGELEALAPQRLKELPVRDPVEPGPKGRPLAKRVQTAPGLEERFLGQVLRRLRTPREIQQIPIDAGVVLLQELAARMGIPAPDRLEERGVRGRGRLRLLCSRTERSSKDTFVPSELPDGRAWPFIVSCTHRYARGGQGVRVLF